MKTPLPHNVVKTNVDNRRSRGTEILYEMPAYSGDMDRALRIQTRVDEAAVTLSVAGTLTATVVADFERALDDARKFRRTVILDLSHVKLIDRPTLKYLIDVMEHDIRLVICPDYVEHWIYRESTRETFEC